jgi:peptidoglycan/LPS O-acetylase OafA/YrhL
VAAIVVIVASLAHVAVERPGIDLGKRLAKTWRGRLAGPVADVAP